LDWVNRELKTTVAIITHNAGIRAMAHRVFTFRDGQIIETVVNSSRSRPADVIW
jgi:putative ABC transport system ATP-binding protein